MEELRRILPEFIGRQKQIPPMYSAIKIDGKRLYQLARAGVEVERPPRDITISDIEILRETDDGFLLKIVCSKGTYVRTLLHDIGDRLGCGGAMSSLTRTRAGIFTIERALSIEQIQAAVQEGSAQSLFVPLDSIL